MHIGVYVTIFFLKLLENALGTVRMIVATNGSKLLGAILQFLIGIVWVMSASLAITNITKDPLKVLVFAIGSAVGSYVGCVVESKIAIGENVIFCITKKESLLDTLNENGFSYTALLGSGINDSSYVLLIALPRKAKKKLLSIIHSADDKAMIISEVSDSIYGGRKNPIY